jgi:drug/metabolite transporter (DMT)-like permease
MAVVMCLDDRGYAPWIALSALLLDETLKPLTMAGGALILLAVLLLAQDEFRRGRP